MSSITIYHNPRCTKSRQGLAYLQERGIEPIVREYLKEPMSVDELTIVLGQLGIPAEKLLRKGEAIFKEQFKGKDLSEAAWIKAMVEHPKLMERPIISDGKRAVIGRPTEQIQTILD